MIRNTADNETLKRTASEQIHYPYVCAECGAEYWWSLQDLRRLTDMPVMPCNHAWAAFNYDWSRDPSQARQTVEQSPRPLSEVP